MLHLPPPHLLRKRSDHMLNIYASCFMTATGFSPNQPEPPATPPAVRRTKPRRWFWQR